MSLDAIQADAVFTEIDRVRKREEDMLTAAREKSRATWATLRDIRRALNIADGPNVVEVLKARLAKLDATEAELRAQEAEFAAFRLESGVQSAADVVALRIELKRAQEELAALRAPVGDAEAWVEVWGRIEHDLRRESPGTITTAEFSKLSVSRLLSRYHAAFVTAATSDEAFRAWGLGNDYEEGIRAALTHARAVVAPGNTGVHVPGALQHDAAQSTLDMFDQLTVDHSPAIVVPYSEWVRIRGLDVCKKCHHDPERCATAEPSEQIRGGVKFTDGECTCRAIMVADHTRHFKGCAMRERYPDAPTPRCASREEMVANFRALLLRRRYGEHNNDVLALEIVDAALALHPDTAEIVRERDEALRQVREESASRATAWNERAEQCKRADTAEAEAKRLGAELAEVESCRVFAVDSAAKAEAAVTQLRAELAKQCDYKGALDTIREVHLGMPPWVDGAEKTADAVKRQLDELRYELTEEGARLQIALRPPPLPVTVEAMQEAYDAGFRMAGVDRPHLEGLTAVARLVVAAVRAGGAAITLEECGAKFDELVGRASTDDEDSRDLCRWYLTTAIERACPVAVPITAADMAKNAEREPLFTLPKRRDKQSVEGWEYECWCAVEAELQRLGGAR